MKQQAYDIRIQELSKRTEGKLQRAFRVRRNLGSLYLSDSTDRYWCVSVRVSKRKGRYLKIEHQGPPGKTSAEDIRATADNFVASRNRRPYQFISPVEWARFAALSTELKGKAADEHNSEVVQARATLDRMVADERRRTC
jgi:hypothetical protein